MNKHLSPKKYEVRYFSWLIVVLLMMAGCDLPRDNPLDPDAYNYGQLEIVEPELPVLTVTSFRSSQWFPPDDIISLEAFVSGASAGLADSVFLIYSDSILYSLSRLGNDWRGSLESSDFYVLDLEFLVGAAFRAILYFNGGEEVVTDEAYLFRVIDDVPEVVAPNFNDSVSSAPEFFWQSQDEPFSFTFTLTINHISTSNYITEVAALEGVHCDSTSYTYPDSLVTGSFYWTIAIVDTLGNISRSKEALFRVTP